MFLRSGKFLVVALVILLVALTLTACGSEEADTPIAPPEAGQSAPTAQAAATNAPATSVPPTEPAPPAEAPTAAPVGLADAIVGYWGCPGEEGSFWDIDFLVDGALGYTFSYWPGTYEVLGETTGTIVLHYGDEESVLRVSDLTGDTATFRQPDGSSSLCRRLPTIPDLLSGLVGLWVFDSPDLAVDAGLGEWFEAFPDGRYMWGDAEMEPSYYLNGSNLVWFTASGGDWAFRVISAQPDRLDVCPPMVAPDVCLQHPPLTYRRVPGIKNLAQHIVGLWRYEPSAEQSRWVPSEMEFGEGGLAVFTYSGEDPRTDVWRYQIMGDATILLYDDHQELQDGWTVVGGTEDALELSGGFWDAPRFEYKRVQQ